MPTIRSSEEGRRLARLRWERQRQREAEAWLDDALSFAVLTKSEQRRLIGAALRQGAEGALCEVAPSIITAAAEAGIDRPTAERLADLAVLLTTVAIERSGGPKISLPAPETWRQTVNWGAIYDPDGKSLVTGRIARESAAEKAEADGD